MKRGGERVGRVQGRLGSATQGRCQCTFRISPTQRTFLKHQVYTRQITTSMNRDLPVDLKLSRVTGNHKRARKLHKQNEMHSPCSGSHTVQTCPRAHQEINNDKAAWRGMGERR